MIGAELGCLEVAGGVTPLIGFAVLIALWVTWSDDPGDPRWVCDVLTFCGWIHAALYGLVAVGQTMSFVWSDDPTRNVDTFLVTTFVVTPVVFMVSALLGTLILGWTLGVVLRRWHGAGQVIVGRQEASRVRRCALRQAWLHRRLFRLAGQSFEEVLGEVCAHADDL